MKKIKIADATTHQLNWLVAQVLGAEFGKDASGAITATLTKPNITFLGTLTTMAKIEGKLTVLPGGTFSPTTRPEQGLPIIEKRRLWMCACHGSSFWFSESKDIRQYGETPLIAGLRCLIASELCLDAEVPDEL